MRWYPLCFVTCVLTAAGCGDDAMGPAASRDSGPPGRRDAGSDGGRLAGRDAGIVTPVDAGARGMMTVAGGDVMGDWCGDITVSATVTVPAGATLTVCAGSTVTFADRAGMTVAGTLALEGTLVLPITMTSGGMWQGLSITGTLDAAFTDISRSSLALEGRAASTITFNDSSITASTNSFTLLNGGTLDRTSIVGGNTALLSGGMLRMTDSIIDFGHPGGSPDCTAFGGASGAVLDHIRFTGCHCPMHIQSATGGVTVTNSILDGAYNPVMIANTTAEFHGNNFIGVGSKMLDIGNNITADVSGNYWGGPTADVSTGDPTQFTGTSVVETAPIAGAGPR